MSATAVVHENVDVPRNIVEKNKSSLHVTKRRFYLTRGVWKRFLGLLFDEMRI